MTCGIRLLTAASANNLHASRCKKDIHAVTKIATKLDGAFFQGCSASEFSLHLFHQSAGGNLVHRQVKENGNGLTATSASLKAHFGWPMPPRIPPGAVPFLAKVTATGG